MSSRLVVAAVVAVLTVAGWLLIFPSDWSSVATADPDTLASPVTGAHWALLAVLLGVLGLTAGLAGHPWVPVLAAGIPALVLYCIQAGSAEVVGANLWVIGAGVLAVALAGGLIVAGWAGYVLRRRLPG
ncbi:hypothetical protein BH20ACT5_BH20ACT5_24940 [soil metagenome]